VKREERRRKERRKNKKRWTALFYVGITPIDMT
jgi:hypothetical protein